MTPRSHSHDWGWTKTLRAYRFGMAETTATSTTEPIERVFAAWDEALGAKDLDAAMQLYHPDATLESPLVCHLLGCDQGIIRGRDDLRAFVTKVFAHQPAQRRRHRAGFLTDGSRLTWEYPRESPEGDQMDIVEVMEIRDGLIARHRVYWGWVSVGMLTSGEHSR
jgi:ketosteroid isomerase-like protein